MKLEVQVHCLWEQGCSYCDKTVTLKETMTSINGISVMPVKLMYLPLGVSSSRIAGTSRC